MREWSITSWLHHLKKISSTQSIVQTLQSTSQVTTLWEKWLCSTLIIRELKQPRRWRQQKPHKSAYFDHAKQTFFYILKTFSFFLWREMTCFAVVAWTMSAHDDKFSILYSCPNCWFQFNSRIVRKHFSSIMTVNNWKMIAEMQLHFQMTFWLPLTSCVLKLPIIVTNTTMMQNINFNETSM